MENGNGKFCSFFKSLLNFRAQASQSEHNKVSYTNFVKFRLQSMSLKIERAFEKMTKNVFAFILATPTLTRYCFCLFPSNNPKPKRNHQLASSRAKTRPWKSQTCVKYRGIILCIERNTEVIWKYFRENCPNMVDF